MIRIATEADIDRMMIIRFAVKENRLNNPSLVTAADCLDFIINRGKGWVAEDAGVVRGFAIADLVDHNVWALFMEPGFEGKGYARALQKVMLDWYFSQTDVKIWLGTAPGTRAADFYRKSGWKELGMRSNGELYFEMEKSDWELVRPS